MGVINADDTYKQILELRKKIALSENGEEKEFYSQQIADLRKNLSESRKKQPVFIPCKSGKTVGEKMEKKLSKVHDRRVVSKIG